MRIAVSIWEDKISPVLDSASKLLIIKFEAQKEVSRFEVYLLEKSITRRCHFIRGLNVDVLICGAVSHEMSTLLTTFGISVISGISGPFEDILKAYLRKSLQESDFFMPGCGRAYIYQRN